MKFSPPGPARLSPLRLIVAAAAALALLIGASTVFAVDSITTPDPTENAIATLSLQLDANGYPVVAYRDNVLGDLKVMHCNDANCAGDDESIEVVDSTNNVGRYPALILDANGYPVVAYADETNDTLKVLHCNDANCSGGDESITEPVSGELIYPSIQLDSQGYPVVAATATGSYQLVVLHCNDVNCAGSNESITSPETADYAGWDPSLALDSNGYPVIAYAGINDFDDLRVMHCNDANCSGDDESIQTPVSGFGASSPGEASLALDANGFPVVAYKEGNGLDLRLLHCNDVNCAGDDESDEVVEDEGNSGNDTSMALDASGFPVIAYRLAGHQLRIRHCDDPNCAGGDESLAIVDADNAGSYASLQLDAAGNPVVAYTSVSGGQLRILHCDDQFCIVDADGDGVPDGDDDCADTPSGPVDSSGCSDDQVDADGDGVCDPGAPSGGPSGCSGSDVCPGTTGPADADGCSDAQVDADGDGVCDPGAPSVGPSTCGGSDSCPGDPEDIDGVNDDDGCPETDADGDGIDDDVDEAPLTSSEDFSDVGQGGSTSGRILQVPAGMTIAISDAAAPGGVRITVTGGFSIQQVIIRLDGKTGFYRFRAGTYVLTDPAAVSSVTTETGGPAEIELEVNGSTVLISVDAGETVRITETTEDGVLVSVVVEAVSGSIEVDGVALTAGGALELIGQSGGRGNAIPFLGQHASGGGGAFLAPPGNATPTPAPQTSAPAGPITPPNTGDAGLATASQGTSAPLAALLIALTLAGCGARLLPLARRN